MTNPASPPELDLLPGIPEAKVRALLDRAPGNELASGKFASPQSSSALAVNGFGLFLDQPNQMPPFPCLAELDWPARSVALEREMRFPWNGGHHPWLDAAVETDTCLIGVESKRFEPFRGSKAASLSPAYDRDVWGSGMTAWCAIRDRLRGAPQTYRHLDAAQLVKHAFGLVTEGRRVGKSPVLLYLFAEPDSIRSKSAEAISRHRDEIAGFTDAVGAEDLVGGVRFAACSWREWLGTFDGVVQEHATRILDRFAP